MENYDEIMSNIKKDPWITISTLMRLLTVSHNMLISCRKDLEWIAMKDDKHEVTPNRYSMRNKARDCLLEMDKTIIKVTEDQNKMIDELKKK